MEHRLEYCVHNPDLTVDDRFVIFANNTTAVAKYDDTPVQSNFEYTQWRWDPNEWMYKVHLFVPDPQNDPLSSLIRRDRKTLRGVEEAYNYTYVHNYRNDTRGYGSHVLKVDGWHHYKREKQYYS